MELKLRTPITAHGESVQTLTFRAPLGADLAQCGMPFDILQDENGKQGARVNGLVVRALISRLAGIPTSSVDLMGARDFRDAAAIINSFFAEEAKS